ncbi:MAG: hypothetical protein V4501_05235 [Pseudomonadota bacterium]
MQIYLKIVFIVLLQFGLVVTAFGAKPVPAAPAKVPLKHKFPIHIDGNIRAYYFTREYSNPQLDAQSAFSLGGKINFLTDPFWNGFRIGGTVYTAQPLGLNSNYFLRQDRTLPGSPITVLGQSFGQYQNPYLLMRIGNQLLTTPWMNGADTRMIPATYQGLYVAVTPVTGLDLIGIRQISFKGRPADHFSKTNLYNSYNVGGANLLGLGNKTDIGTLAFAATYHQDELRMAAWVYHFYNYANLAYADVHYKLVTSSIIKPLFGLQLGHEWNDGSEILNSVGAGSTRADVFGMLLGMEIAHGFFTLSGNVLPKYSGAYRNGDVVSPYTVGYISDPLYTTSMIAGLIEKAAGTAFKVAAEYDFFGQTLLVRASYAKYFTTPFLANTDETDVDVTFKPNGLFKNLSIRDRIGFLNGNQNLGHFIYNRVMLEYDFLS